MLEQTDKDYIADAISQAITGALKISTTLPPVTQGGSTAIETVVTDPLVSVADDKLAEIIKNAPTGNIIVKGRRGAQMINQSEESANMITDIIKNKKHRYTRNNLF